jgi:hypothetical protein
MDTPVCLKCGTADSMALDDSGPTYKSWRCMTCGTPRTKKTFVGKALPFVTPALILIGLELPDGGPPDVSS